jgi:DNA polymerase III epsilon subunit-like protein
MCNGGVPIDVAMRQFYADYMRCNAIVAHNIDFDRAMIKIEFARICGQDRDNDQVCYQDRANEYPCWDKIFDPGFEKACDKETICTMRWGRNICKIERTDRHGKPYWKSPKLSELYEHLFQEPAPDGLHNALVDTLVCLRCYVKLRFRFDLRMDTYEAILSASTK